MLSKEKLFVLLDRTEVSKYLKNGKITNASARLPKIVNKGNKKTTIVCGLCERNFSSNHNLVAHMKTHTGEKPFTCHICTKSFQSISNLNVHVQIHSSEKLFKCETCEKTFVTKAYLSQHIKCHTMKPLHKCNICSARMKYLFI